MRSALPPPLLAAWLWFGPWGGVGVSGLLAWVAGGLLGCGRGVCGLGLVAGCCSPWPLCGLRFCVFPGTLSRTSIVWISTGISPLMSSVLMFLRYVAGNVSHCVTVQLIGVLLFVVIGCHYVSPNMYRGPWVHKHSRPGGGNSARSVWHPLLSFQVGESYGVPQAYGMR